VNEQERSVNHSRKVTCAFAIFGAVAVCAVLPYGLSGLRHTGSLPSDGAVAGVILAYYCLLAEVLLWPLALLELWNPKGLWRKVLDIGIGAYFIALATLFFGGAAYSPAW
jgi:hypothetical protein